MKFVNIHNGIEIPQYLGILISFDQFLHSWVPGADLDRTISHRLGVKRAKLALRAGLVTRADLYHEDGAMKRGSELSASTFKILSRVRIPRRQWLAALIDRGLENIDDNHTIWAIGS